MIIHEFIPKPFYPEFCDKLIDEDGCIRNCSAPKADHAVCTCIPGLPTAADCPLHDSPLIIPMILWCPACSSRHIDKDRFENKPHHTHACQHCGMVWRPAICYTVGVQFLPGFKDAP